MTWTFDGQPVEEIPQAKVREALREAIKDIELSRTLASSKSILPPKTLRDEFAMAALDIAAERPGTKDAAGLAKVAYEVADAMLAERSKGREG